MSDVTIDLSVPRYRRVIVAEVDGPDDDPSLEVTVSRPVELDADGATTGTPELVLRTGPEGITLTDREQILELQAVVNRAVNQWRSDAGHLA